MSDDDASYIIIKFETVGSALYEIIFNNVKPTQAFAALPGLELIAKNLFIQEENARVSQKLAVPKPGIEVPGGRK